MVRFTERVQVGLERAEEANLSLILYTGCVVRDYLAPVGLFQWGNTILNCGSVG